MKSNRVKSKRIKSRRRVKNKSVRRLKSKNRNKSIKNVKSRRKSMNKKSYFPFDLATGLALGATAVVIGGGGYYLFHKKRQNYREIQEQNDRKWQEKNEQVTREIQEQLAPFNRKLQALYKSEQQNINHALYYYFIQKLNIIELFAFQSKRFQLLDADQRS